MKPLALAPLMGLAAALALSAEARVIEFEIGGVEPFAEGTSFGDHGPYERVSGVARGVLDPEDPQNAVIVNLDKAPRNADGLVEYDMDVFILRPTRGSPGRSPRPRAISSRWVQSAGSDSSSTTARWSEARPNSWWQDNGSKSSRTQI